MMVRTIFVGIALLLATGTTFAADQAFKGYLRKDGTYVEPYHRTTPDNNLYDNYASQAYLHPWTGHRGTERNEFSNSPAYNQSSPLYKLPPPAPIYDPQPSPPERR